MSNLHQTYRILNTISFAWSCYKVLYRYAWINFTKSGKDLAIRERIRTNYLHIIIHDELFTVQLKMFCLILLILEYTQHLKHSSGIFTNYFSKKQLKEWSCDFNTWDFTHNVLVTRYISFYQYRYHDRSS